MLTADSAPVLQRLLAARPIGHIHWGLARIQRMLAALGNPERSFRCIHVGGTNGKGSVAAMIASVLRCTDRSTGLYTSPHLVDFSERIQIDGRVADASLLDACAAEVAPVAKEVGATFFEAATALACLTFARAEIEVAAMEVGLGGRLDATNVLRPDVSVITNVAYDHAEYLGETLEEIAAEKAGILKPGVPGVLGPMPARLGAVCERRARQLGTALALVGRDAAIESVRVDLDGTSFIYRSPRAPDGIRLRTPLLGSHQAVNAATALLALERFDWEWSERQIAMGLERLHWPGRMQLLRTAGGMWVLDVAHNTAGASAVAEALRELQGLDRPAVILLAILGDKAWREMLDPLLSSGMAAVFTIAPSSPPERRWDPQVAREAVRGHRVEVIEDFGDALRRARELAGSGTVIVGGSCHTVGDALTELVGAFPQRMHSTSDTQPLIEGA